MRNKLYPALRGTLQAFAHQQWHLAAGLRWPVSTHQWLRINGLTGCLFSCLHKAGCRDVPEYSVLREAFQADVVRTAHFQGWLKDFSRQAAALGLKILLVKGAGLWQTVYRDQPALRSASDVDLLVPAEEYSRIEEFLLEMGFDGSLGGGNFYSRHGYALDVQTTLTRKMESPYRLPVVDLWQRAQPVESLPGLWRLSAEDSFIHTCIHSLKHSYLRLIWLLDLYLLAQQVDPGELARLSRLAGSDRAVSYALYALETFGLEVAWARLWSRPNLAERQVMRRILTQCDNSMLGVVLIGLGVTGLRNKAQYFYNLILQDSDGLHRTVPETNTRARVLGVLRRWLRQ